MGEKTGAANTLTFTVSVSLAVFSVPTVNVSVKVSVMSSARPVGAKKLGVAVVAPVSVTVGLPPVWLQRYLIASPGGPLDSVPSRFTKSPSFTVWSGPASGAGPNSTVTFTISVALAPPAVTVSSNDSVVSVVTIGAVKLGLAVVAPVRDTVSPATCLQA